MSQKEKYILAIDLGTSGPKSALFTTGGKLIDYEFEKTELLLFPGGGAEQDPAEWWRAIVTATRRLLEKKPAPVEDIVGICCTTQWSGTVAVDPGGEPLMNAIIWMDSRGSPHIKGVAGGWLFTIEGFDIWKLRRWLKLTAGVPGNSGKDSIAHILYIKNEKPEVYKKTFKFLEPKDYLNLKLTGKFAASYDSITMHWITDNRNLYHVDYEESLLQMAGLERAHYPDLKQAVDVLGTLQPEVAEELGLRPETKVVMGTPDMHSAAIGSGAVRDYESHLYIGTSSWILCHVPWKKTDIFHNMATLPSAIPGRYLAANEQETAGACLSFLADNILYHKDLLLQEEKQADLYKLFDQIVAGVPAGSDKLLFTPWLYGERTPVDDHTARAAFVNISLKTTREHLIRAVFEGVALNARWLLYYLEKFVSRSIPALNVIGGGANSDIWCQIHADVFNRTIRQVKDPIMANARGAAMLGAVGLGYLTFDDIARHVEIKAEYSPNPAHRQIYDELYQEFVHFYQQNRKMYRRLNS